jgi:hypothetical protein
MVADIEKLRRCEPAVVIEVTEWRLDVEWMNAGQTNKSRISGNVFIWSL